MKNYQHEIKQLTRAQLEKAITNCKNYSGNYAGNYLNNLKLKELKKELNKR